MQAWKIAKKDMRLLARDRRSLFILIALPLLFITILGFSAGQLFSEKEKARKYRLGVVDVDASPLSAKLIGEVVKLNALEVSEMSDLDAAKEMLADGKLEVLVFIGPHYHGLVEELELGDVFYTQEGRLAGKLRSLDIDVYTGPFLVNAGEIVKELVFAFGKETIGPDVLKAREPKLAERLFLKIRHSKPDQDEAASPTVAPLATKPHADIVYQFLVPSYTVMFVFFIVNFMARSLIGERETGTLGRLLIAPLTRSELMLGKLFPFLIISLVQTM